MFLHEIGEDGSVRDVSALSHRREFDLTWMSMRAVERAAIEEKLTSSGHTDDISRSQLGRSQTQTPQ
jgi:hypothetical protein